MKEYEKLAESYALEGKTFGLKDDTCAVAQFAYEAGFLKAREMLNEMLPNSPDIDFKAFEELGETEV